MNIPEQKQAKAVYDAVKDELKITFTIKGVGRAYADAFKGGITPEFIEALRNAKKKYGVKVTE